MVRYLGRFLPIDGEKLIISKEILKEFGIKEVEVAGKKIKVAVEDDRANE